MRRFKISSEDQDMIIRNRESGKPAAARTGFIGVVQFRGPRGRVYRATWRQVRLTIDEAIQDVANIRQGNYAHGAFPVSDDVVEIDATGKEVA